MGLGPNTFSPQGARVLQDLDRVEYDNGELTIEALEKITNSGGYDLEIEGDGGTVLLTTDAEVNRDLTIGRQITMVSGRGIVWPNNDSIVANDDATKIARNAATIIAVEDSNVKSTKPISILEQAVSPPGYAAGYGRFWVKNEAPCELYFQTDAGDDIQITDGTSLAGGGGGATKHWMDWYMYNVNLAVQNAFYATLHNDEYGASATINSDLTTSGYSTTSLASAWRMIRFARRVPYSGTITKFLVHLEVSGTAADTDVEVALWWGDALADDTAHSVSENITCDHLCTLTFDFSSTSRFMHKQTTSFNATSISEGDWLFITLRKTTSGDGSYIHCHPTILWDGS